MGKRFGFGVGLALVGVGCGTTTDLRGSSAVSAAAPWVLVEGPARVLHANFDRRAGVTFYRAWRRGGAAPDCRAGSTLAWDGEADLEVTKDESICVVVSRASRISWHVRPIGEAAGSTAAQVVALAAH